MTTARQVKIAEPQSIVPEVEDADILEIGATCVKTGGVTTPPTLKVGGLNFGIINSRFFIDIDLIKFIAYRFNYIIEQSASELICYSVFETTSVDAKLKIIFQ